MGFLGRIPRCLWQAIVEEVHNFAVIHGKMQRTYRILGNSKVFLIISYRCFNHLACMMAPIRVTNVDF